MSVIGDSRRPDGAGPGVLPMRHWEYHDAGIQLDMRACVLGVEIKDRDETGEGFGGYEYVGGTVGDIIGGQLWAIDQGDKGSREIPGWRFSWPTIVHEQRNETSAAPLFLPIKTLSPIQEKEDRAAAEGVLKHSTESWERDARFYPKARRNELAHHFSDSPHDEKEKILMPEIQAARLWQRFPVGYTGLTMGLNREDVDETVFLPTDPRLISDWDSTYGDFGTFVCDLGLVGGLKPGEVPEGPRLILDPDAPGADDPINIAIPVASIGLETKRRAPMQALCRVVPGPFKGCDVWPMTSSHMHTKWGSLALNIGMTFNRMNPSFGGIFWDDPVGGFVTAKTSAPYAPGGNRRSMGGPLDVGGVPLGADRTGEDKHFLLTDGDGKSVNSMHISLDAFYCRSKEEGKEPEFDAPLRHDGEKKEYPKHADVWREVKFVYDAGLTHPHPCEDRELEGRHIWLAGCISEYGQHTPPQGSEVGAPKPPKPPEPPPPPGGGGVVPPPAGDGAGAGGAAGVSGAGGAAGAPRTLSDTAAFREYNQIYSETAMPGLLARPQFQSSSAVDFLNWAGPEVNKGIDPEPHRVSFRRDSPLVGRLEAYGKQTQNQWAYTHSPSGGGRYAPTGTADGGWVFTAPESSLLQTEGNTQPATVSNPYFIFSPNTRLGFGRPDTGSGQMKSGYSLEVDGVTNNIKGYQENGSTRTQVMELSDDIRLTTAGKGLILKSPSGYYSYRISVTDSGKVVTATA